MLDSSIYFTQTLQLIYSTNKKRYFKVNDTVYWVLDRNLKISLAHKLHMRIDSTSFYHVSKFRT